MDVVWKCIFGIDVNIQENPNLGYFVKTKETAEGFTEFEPYFLTISTETKLYYYHILLKIGTNYYISQLISTNLGQLL